MARIDSLSIFAKDGGKELLREAYGPVIENIEHSTLTAKLKNTALSGTPGAGTYECKRFVNRTTNEYGTARFNNKGQTVRAQSVVVSVDTDRELITEAENKDVMLYGVDNFVTRQAQQDQKALTRELERAFFTCAANCATDVTPTSTEPTQKLEDLIQAAETVKNDFVDGVDRDMISVICTPNFYGKIRDSLDNTYATSTDIKEKEFNTFHGVKVYSSVYLPTGTGISAGATVTGTKTYPTDAECKTWIQNNIGYFSPTKATPVTLTNDDVTAMINFAQGYDAEASVCTAYADWTTKNIDLTMFKTWFDGQTTTTGADTDTQTNAGVSNCIVMVDGSIAQPTLTNIIPAERIQLSNAVAFGLFCSYGTKVITPDLIFKA